MRGLWSTLALVLVLAGLGAYIYFVDSARPASGIEPKDKVFAVEAGQIREMRVTADGETTVLVRQDEGWRITEPSESDADPTEASSLVTNLSSLDVNRVVDENATDLAPYGLAEPRIRVAFTAEDGTSGEIQLGSQTPTLGDVYAIRTGETAVFLVSSYTETTFDKQPFDLRDKRAVKFQREQVDSVEVQRGTAVLRLARADSNWTVTAPAPGRADYTAVEGLLTRLSTAAMASLVAEDAANLAPYGLDTPAMTITLGAGSSRTVLDIGGTEGEARYARDRARPIVFTLDTTLADDITRPFEDYRKKELFEFRTFNVDRVRLTRAGDGGARTWDFERTSSEDGDQWRVTPEGGEAADLEAARADALTSALTALRASSFAAGTASTGLNRPVLTVGVSYDNGTFERVRIGRAGAQAYAQREGEGSIALVDQAAVDAVVASLDAALAPPAPAEDPK